MNLNLSELLLSQLAIEKKMKWWLLSFNSPRVKDTLHSVGRLRHCDKSLTVLLGPEAGQSLVEHSANLARGWSAYDLGSLYSCLEPGSKKQMLILGGRGALE